MRFSPVSPKYLANSYTALQLGPTDAWVTLDTVTLTNSPQLYFDLTMFRQPTRLYRLVAAP
jgi:hypothetical protein